MAEITKKDLRETVDKAKELADQEGYKYNPKNAANDLRWFTPEEEKAQAKAFKNLKAEIKKQKASLGEEQAKKLLVGLEAASYEFNRDREITTVKLTGASIVNTKKDSVNMFEDGPLSMIDKDVNHIQAMAEKKNKKLESKKIAGQKIGESLQLYKTDAMSLVDAVVKGQDCKTVVENLTQQQNMTF